MIKRLFLLFLIANTCACKSPPRDVPAILAHACQWLWSQQNADGGWHSKTHGILKSGQALSPFILFTLLEVPDNLYVHPADRVARGLDFIRRNISEAGKAGVSDPVLLEYPNYATAYSLHLLARYGDASDSTCIRSMRHYLVFQQFTEQRGYTPEDLVYGGWGFGETLPPGDPGHVDLSHTRRILQALQEAGVRDPDIYEKALVFMSLLQKRPGDKRPQPPADMIHPVPYDGGFYYSPVVWGGNKAGVADTMPAYFQSYATATADGLLALLAAGAGPDDPRVQDAFGWLKTHRDWSYSQGIPTDNPANWNLVLKFYHIAVRAEALAAMGVPKGEFDPAVTLLAGLQQPDGRFFNPNGAPNKEDDPLLATALAVAALHFIQRP